MQIINMQIFQMEKKITVCPIFHSFFHLRVAILYLQVPLSTALSAVQLKLFMA